MDEQYTSGVAFVMEGDTEKVFYMAILNHLVHKHPNTELTKEIDSSNGETFYILRNKDEKILIKFNVVGTISQITNSGKWFENRCYSGHKQLDWTVFLCYDTDSYKNDITKFYEGDWKALRKSIAKHKKCTVIDLASQADIEDVMLIDIEGIFSFLGISPVPIPTGKKGKSKMKKLFRLKGNGCAYHEGDRAEDLINSLNLDKIMEASPMKLEEIEARCFQGD